MKNRFFFTLIACFVLFFVSCLDNDVSLPDSQMKDAVQVRSLSTNSEHYYYYEGRKIPLNVHPAKRYVVVKHDALTSVATLAINTTQDTYYVSENQRGYIVDIDTTEIANVFTNVNTLDLLAEDDNVLAIEYVIGDSILTPVSNKFYVKLKKLSDISLLEKYAEAIGCKVEGSIASDDYWIRLSSDKGAIFNSVEASNFIYETGDFDDIDPGFIFNFQPCSAPIDTYYNSQWNMHGTYGIGAEQAWNVTKGNASITVAVVDKGISMNHEDFVGRIHSYVYNCDEDNNIPKIYEPHGTIVTGVIAANHNNIGVTASNQYGFHAYNFDYTHYPRTDMMTIEEEQEYEQEKQEEEQQ